MGGLQPRSSRAWNLYSGAPTAFALSPLCASPGLRRECQSWRNHPALVAAISIWSARSALTLQRGSESPLLPGAQGYLNSRGDCWPVSLAGPRKHLLSAMILRSSTSSSVLLGFGGLSVLDFIVGSARAAPIVHHPGALLQWFRRRSAFALQHRPKSPLRTGMQRRASGGQCIVPVLNSAGVASQAAITRCSTSPRPGASAW